MEKYPELDIRVTEMKTQDIQQALHAGDIDAAIIASKLEDTFLKEETLFMKHSSDMFPAKNLCSSTT